MSEANIFLFSIDLEDVRRMVPEGERMTPRVPELTHRYLEFLQKHDSRATFFVVGEVAEEYPQLIREIAARGHEIACHSQHHITLDRMNRQSFEADLKKNLETLKAAGATEISGYRAPTFSLTEERAWAYEVLAKLGFTYSSSVLPAKNPLFGWPGFGESPRRMQGVTEIPMLLSGWRGLNVPFGGGVYFRVLPFTLTQRAFKKAYAKNLAVPGYFHPYDIDTRQERIMHPNLKDNSFYNRLMYLNRNKVFPRLEKLLKAGTRIVTYREYLNQLHA